jgi:WD40 repeat protein
MANVALSFDAWKPGAVRPATVEVPVQVIEAVEAPQLTATLKGHDDFVGQVAWAPDGKVLATLRTGKRELRLWDVAERKELHTLTSDLGECYGLAFTPDGKTLLTAHHHIEARTALSGGISLWDVATGESRGVLPPAPARGVFGLALAPDGKMIAAAETWKEGDERVPDRCVTLRDRASGKLRASLPDETYGVLAFSPDGKVLARSAYVRKENQIASVEIRRRDLTTNQELPALVHTASKSPMNCMAFSPDGRTVAAATFEGDIILWDTASGEIRTTMKTEDRRRVSSLAFAPDGRTLAVGVADRLGRDHEPGLIILWDAATGQRRLTLTGHTNAVLAVAFSPDGRLLASGSSDRTVRLWDMTAPPAPGAASDGRQQGR